MKKLSILTTFVLAAITSLDLNAATNRERDIIYHKTEGVALTMDVFIPEKLNGAAVIKIVSGGWISKHERITDGSSKPYTDHGYTVFAVVHGSQPRYKVPEIINFMHRAVRFIRFNADRWNINPNRIGVTGRSAGGHLSLILATKGGPGDSEAQDPVDRVGIAVQAAAVYYPPTDYRNWAEPGDMVVGVGKLAQFKSAFGPKSLTAEGREELGRAISSIYHVGRNTAPVHIIHGEMDINVPLFQSESFGKVAKDEGGPFKLVVKPGAKYGWENMIEDEASFVAWFDEHLLK